MLETIIRFQLGAPPTAAEEAAGRNLRRRYLESFVRLRSQGEGMLGGGSYENGPLGVARSPGSDERRNHVDAVIHHPFRAGIGD